MNTCTKKLTSVLNRYIRLTGAIVAITFIMPDIAFSQISYNNPTIVDLGTSGDYRALSGTALTIASGCTVTGNVGGIAVTNGGTVNGRIDINNAAVTTAINDLTTVKNDLALRTPNDATLIVSLDGLILGRGIYTGPGTFSLNGTLTLTGTASDIFIFQTTTTLITYAACHVTMGGTALASNVYWQVGSAATIDGDFKGNILAGTFITQNGGTIDGRTLGHTAVTLGGVSALPVELISFKATLNNSIVELNWDTATEVNNYGFNIERRVKSEEWTKIGFVQGHGNSYSPKEYSFIDSNPINGKLQYRLKQIDLDGVFEYSDVAEIEFIVLKQFTVNQNYPNPFNPTTNISYEIPMKSNVVIKVFNVIGNEVAVLLNEEKHPGRYQVVFNASHFASGIYFYSIDAGEFKTIIKKMIHLK